jgi:hypothetical protein
MTDVTPPAKDPYKILDVSRDASREEIRKAYVKLARKYHPDMHPPGTTYAEEQFKEVASAYEVLSDESLRARYDQGPTRTVRREPVDIDPALLSMIQQQAHGAGGPQSTLMSSTTRFDRNLRLALLYAGLGFAALVTTNNPTAGFVLFAATASLAAGWLALSITRSFSAKTWLARSWFVAVTALVALVFTGVGYYLVRAIA